MSRSRVKTTEALKPREYTPDGATLIRFHRSKAFARMLRGPRGSGKSTAIVWDIWFRMRSMRPMTGTRIRSSKWVFVAATRDRILSTAVHEWLNWFPEPITEMTYGTQITGRVALELPDGTVIDAHILFTEADDLQSAGKFKSNNLTGAWIVEAAEILSPDVYLMLRPCIGRWPGPKDGGASWAGILSDTNSMPYGHWWQRYQDEVQPSDMEFFDQPPALLDACPFDPANPVYIPNTGQDRRWGPAENIKHLRGGFNYYMRMVGTYPREWVLVFIQNKYGNLTGSRLVYPEYRDDEHAKRGLFPYRGICLRLGFDWGLTPRCIICQLDSYGTWRCLEEVCGTSIGARNFARQDLAPVLLKRYAGIPIIAAGDPAGGVRDQSNESTCFKELEEIGITVHKAPSQNLIARRESVAAYLSPSKKFVLDIDRCPQLHEGFKGNYHLDKDGKPDKDAPESHVHDALQAIMLYSSANPSDAPTKWNGNGCFSEDAMKAMGFGGEGSRRIQIPGMQQLDASGELPVDTSGNSVPAMPPSDEQGVESAPDPMAWAVEG